MARVGRPRKNLVLPGGTQRSRKALPYHLLPSAGTRRIAERFGFGAAKYGEDQWIESLDPDRKPDFDEN